MYPWLWRIFVIVSLILMVSCTGQDDTGDDSAGEIIEDYLHTMPRPSSDRNTDKRDGSPRELTDTEKKAMEILE